MERGKNNRNNRKLIIMRIYISGRITGLDYANVEAKFQDAQDLLSDIGFEVVNPLNNGLTKEHSWEQHMDKDFELLCDHSSMVYSLKKYDDEKKFNPNFRVLAEKVESILNKTSDAKS